MGLALVIVVIAVVVLFFVVVAAVLVGAAVFVAVVLVVVVVVVVVVALLVLLVVVVVVVVVVVAAVIVLIIIINFGCLFRKWAARRWCTQRQRREFPQPPPTCSWSCAMWPGSRASRSPAGATALMLQLSWPLSCPPCCHRRRPSHLSSQMRLIRRDTKGHKRASVNSHRRFHVEKVIVTCVQPDEADGMVYDYISAESQPELGAPVCHTCRVFAGSVCCRTFPPRVLSVKEKVMACCSMSPPRYGQDIV